MVSQKIATVLATMHRYRKADFPIRGVLCAALEDELADALASVLAMERMVIPVVRDTGVVDVGHAEGLARLYLAGRRPDLSTEQMRAIAAALLARADLAEAKEARRACA